MNPLTNMKNVKKLSEQELNFKNKTSWHDQYRSSAWIFVGGFPYELTEGDIICIFSQYGEIVNINLIRDKDTGKSKGFGFICYEDQRSTDLAVDNFNGIKILNKTIRVDHVTDYKMPKDSKKIDNETRKLHEEGCAPRVVDVKPVIKREDEFRETLADQIVNDIKLPPRLPIYVTEIKQEKVDEEKTEREEKKDKKKKKHKKEKKKKKSKKRRKSSDSSSSEDDLDERKHKKR
ncbi:RNA-binding motif protein, X-linked 2-like [Onthophagus taurus]|uniref:RNA-binding motif protein, X-linked 2-like n=1 Tax=Onthophagus taurus TaxID=166361 RepID=UPI000C202414|nr:RNA-binding motif protein, X-linked 2-like [Onthophagus taurus]